MESTVLRLINKNKSEICTYYSDFSQIDNTVVEEATKSFSTSVPTEKYRRKYNINITNLHQRIPKINILPVSSQVHFKITT